MGGQHHFYLITFIIFNWDQITRKPLKKEGSTSREDIINDCSKNVKKWSCDVIMSSRMAISQTSLTIVVNENV